MSVHSSFRAKLPQRIVRAHNAVRDRVCVMCTSMYRRFQYEVCLLLFFVFIISVYLFIIFNDHHISSIFIPIIILLLCEIYVFSNKSEIESQIVTLVGHNEYDILYTRTYV